MIKEMVSSEGHLDVLTICSPTTVSVLSHPSIGTNMDENYSQNFIFGHNFPLLAH
jgi:hypothetical protein